MSKTLYIPQLYGHTKDNNSNSIRRESFGKLGLDIKEADFKNSQTSSTVLQDKPLLSPASPSERANHSLTGSFNAKLNQLVFISETQENRDNHKSGKPYYAQTTRLMASSPRNVALGKANKVPTSNERIAYSKSKEPQGKDTMFNFDSLGAKILAQDKDTKKAGVIINYKSKLLDEPKKKGSVPSTLAVTLNNIYTNNGSSSHRLPAASPLPDEIKISNKPASYASFTQRNLKKADKESEVLKSHAITNKHANPHPHIPNFLTEPLSGSNEAKKVAVSFNISKTQEDLIRKDGNLSPKNKDSIESSVEYTNLMRMLKEKNQELQKLSQDKVELKYTLDTLTGEIQGIKKMKSMLNEKDRIIEELEHSIAQVLKESDTVRKDLDTESSSVQKSGKSYIIHRKGTDSIGGETESVKDLIYQLKTITNHSGKIQGDTLEQQKESLLEILTKRQNSTGSRKVNNNVSSQRNVVEAESKNKQPNSPNVPFDVFKKSLSNVSVSKADFSSYYGGLNSSLNKTDATSAMNKKGPLSSKKTVEFEPDSSKSHSVTTTKKSGPLFQTPRKLHLSKEKTESQMRIQSETALDEHRVNEGKGLLNQQTLNNLHLEKLLDKQRSLGGESESPLLSYKSKPSGEGMDIGKALEGLKEKIAKVLVRHKEEHTKLKNTHDMYVQKIEKLMTQ